MSAKDGTTGTSMGQMIVARCVSTVCNHLLRYKHGPVFAKRKLGSSAWQDGTVVGDSQTSTGVSSVPPYKVVQN